MAAAHTPSVPRYHVTMSYLYGLFDYLKQAGIALEPVLAAIHLTPQAIEDRDRLLPVLHLDAALDAAAALANDPLMGFHAGRHMHPAHLGIFGHLLLCCKTPEELLQLTARYSRLVANGADILYEAEGQQMQLRLAFPMERTVYSRQAIEFNLIGWLTLCHWLGGPTLAPDFIDLDYPEAIDYSAMRAFAGCDIRFNTGVVRIGVSQEFLQQAFLLGDTSMKPMLETLISQRLQLLQSHQQQLDPQLARLRQLIADQLPSY